MAQEALCDTIIKKAYSLISDAVRNPGILSEVELKELLIRLKESVSAFQFDQPYFSRLRNIGSFALSVNIGDSGTGRISIPKEHISRLTDGVEQYASFVVKNLYEYIGIGVKQWEERGSALVYLPLMCRICGKPASIDAINKNSQTCRSHYEQTRLT